MLSPDLKSKISRLWDKFWARGITNPITAIEQISYLLFIRRLEEIDNQKMADAKKTKERYVSVFKDKEHLKWSNFKQKAPNVMIKLVSNQAFPFIKKLNKSEQPYARHMKDAVFAIKNATLLKEAIDDIDEIYELINQQQQAGQTFQDTQGDVYEHLLNATNEAGKNGQFRTPRHIIQLICEIVDPDWQDKICDLACGSGGFLLGAYQHILTKYTSTNYKQKDENGLLRGLKGDKIPNDRVWKKLKEGTFFGFDIDQTMVRIGLMNLILHDISVPKIEHLDTLSLVYDKYEKGEQYSVIMANPPFTGRIDKGGKSSKLRVDTNQSELLFLERIIHMLKPNGRAAVIIPEGVLFNSGSAHKKTRENLMKDCLLNAVISLPSGAFKPYTNVKTAILVFTKKKLNSASYNTERVWFYELRSDGYSLDDNRRRLNDEPLPHLLTDWKNKEKDKGKPQKGQHFYVPIDEIIKNNFDLTHNRYSEFEYEAQDYEPPKDLLIKIMQIEHDILDNLNELSRLII